MTDRDELWEYAWHKAGCRVLEPLWKRDHDGSWEVGSHRSSVSAPPWTPAADLMATLKDCTCGLGLLLEGKGPLAEGDVDLGFRLVDHPNIAGLRLIVYEGKRWWQAAHKIRVIAEPEVVALWDEVQRLRKQLDDEPEPPYMPLKIGHWTLEFTDGTRLQGASGELRA